MSKKRILIVDDDRAVRDAFELALDEQGYQLELAEDGERGLASAAAQRPDLIFLDLKMPGIDGVETLRRLHAADPTLQVYIVTAFSQEYMADLRVAKADGIHFQLAAKPLTAEQIRQIASQALAAE